MKTVWKPIAECPRYEVSNKGKVRNRKTGRVLKQCKFYATRCSYYRWRVYLCINGKGVARYVHRLVAAAFCPNPNNLPWVEHLNGDHADNRAENLRFVAVHPWKP